MKQAIRVLMVLTMIIFLSCTTEETVEETDDDQSSVTDTQDKNNISENENTNDQSNDDNVVVINDDENTTDDQVNDTDTTGQNNNGETFDKNSLQVWTDPETFLIWEEPMGNTGMGGLGPTIDQAKGYCENLVLAGVSDWRVPTIDELRTLIRGVSTTMTGGACPTSENCADGDKCNKDKDNSKGFGTACYGCGAMDNDPNLNYLKAGDCQLDDRRLENGECYRVGILTGPCDPTWSSTVNTSMTAQALGGATYYVNFNSGFVNNDMNLQGNNWVRCIRAGTAADLPDVAREEKKPADVGCVKDEHCQEGYYCVKNECVVEPGITYTDSQTGYIWQSQHAGGKTWEAAVKYCADLELDGKSNWHLPTVSELKTLVKGCAETAKCGITDECNGYTSCGGDLKACSNGCSSGNYLPPELGQDKYSYWTSTEEAVKPTSAWIIDFTVGSVKYILKTWDNQLVRCVHN